MSEITGYTVVQIAAEYLSKPDLGRGAILGSISGITPSEVVIIGAGTIGEYAARAALGHGAIVKVFDNKLYKLRSLQSKLGERIFTSIIHPKVLQKAIKSADVVIGAIHSEFGKSQIIVTEDMVKSMKKGTIIIDASIDQGGCIETSKPTSHTEPIFQFSGVNHYCVPNIPSRVPRTASYALSNFLTPFLLDLSENAGIEKLLANKPGYRHGTYILHGILTNKHIGERFGLSHQDIELLIMALRA
jgi:alanine dehydrogenase